MHASITRSVISLVRVCALIFVCLTLSAQEPIGWQAEAAEKEGDIARAWMLYSQASALEPDNQKYRAKSLELRIPALSLSKVVMMPREVDLEPLDPDLVRDITAEEIAEVARMLPPPELVIPKTRQKFEVRGPVRKVVEQVLEMCKLDTIFDSAFDLTRDISLTLDDATCTEAIHATEMVSGVFIVPISSRLVMVARDNQETRRQQERTVTVTIPIPEPVTVQEVQEVGRGIQQLFEIQKFAIDGTRRMILLRDRYSKVKPARNLLQQLLLYRPQVVIDVEFLQVAKQRDTSLGLDLQSMTQIVNFGGLFNAAAQIPAAFTKFLTFGGGSTLFGIGITNATSFASMTDTQAMVVHRATMRTLDGQVADLHVGDRFPIVVQSFAGSLPPGDLGYVPPPTIQFENLGLTLKITTHVHGSEEVSMEIDSEFKVLTGQASNGIPIIANRKFQGQVRIRSGEWAVAAGMASSSSSQGYSGIAGLSQISAIGTVLRKNDRSQSNSELLIVLKPRIINAAPEEGSTRDLWVGSETKPLPPV